MSSRVRQRSFRFAPSSPCSHHSPDLSTSRTPAFNTPTEMRLLNIYTLQFQEFFENEVPPYHILSHRWSREEISFEEFTRNKIPDKRGYRKVVDFCRFIRQRRQDGLISRRAVDRHGAHRMVGDDMSDLAAHDFEPETGERPMLAGAEWVWIDTCCIDKRSSAELTEAINSSESPISSTSRIMPRVNRSTSWQCSSGTPDPMNASYA